MQSKQNWFRSVTSQNLDRRPAIALCALALSAGCVATGVDGSSPEVTHDDESTQAESRGLNFFRPVSAFHWGRGWSEPVHHGTDAGDMAEDADVTPDAGSVVVVDAGEPPEDDDAGAPRRVDAGGHRSHDSGNPVADDDAGAADDDAGGTTDDDAGSVSHDAGGSTHHDAGGSKPDAGTVTHSADAAAKSTGLHASGGQILGNGTPVRFHGVNFSGSEFACIGGYGFFDGASDQASITAMKSWNINFVRVPLNEDCWLGINGVSSEYSGANYQAAIEAYVALLLANGMYVSLDLHWNAPGTTLATGQQPMADLDHAPAFWTGVANAFKASGDVMFELYNEPYPDNNQDTTAAWTCWLNGGSCPSVSYPVAGMQTLVTTVRATGATNLLLLGGVEYSNALSQWAAHKPTDPLDNLAAAWHVYLGTVCNNETCWDQIEGPLSTSYPIVATEVGDDSCNGAFVTSAMTWLDAHGQSYSGWTWDAWGSACGNYSLISDTTGTPNGTYGAAFQAHFLSL